MLKSTLNIRILAKIAINKIFRIHKRSINKLYNAINIDEEKSAISLHWKFDKKILVILFEKYLI